jgi:hypothetical protein
MFSMMQIEVCDLAYYFFNHFKLLVEVSFAYRQEYPPPITSR